MGLQLVAEAMGGGDVRALGIPREGCPAADYACDGRNWTTGVYNRKPDGSRKRYFERTIGTNRTCSMLFFTSRPPFFSSK